MTTPQADPRLLEIHHGVTFLECLEQCIHSPLLQEWERLSGKTLIAKSVIHRMVDDATGYDLVLMEEFADFCYEYVFLTLPS